MDRRLSSASILALLIYVGGAGRTSLARSLIARSSASAITASFRRRGPDLGARLSDSTWLHVSLLHFVPPTGPASSGRKPQSLAARWGAGVGDASYALYLLHPFL